MKSSSSNLELTNQNLLILKRSFHQLMQDIGRIVRKLQPNIAGEDYNSCRLLWLWSPSGLNSSGTGWIHEAKSGIILGKVIEDLSFNECHKKMLINVTSLW